MKCTDPSSTKEVTGEAEVEAEAQLGRTGEPGGPWGWRHQHMQEETWEKLTGLSSYPHNAALALHCC